MLGAVERRSPLIRRTAPSEEVICPSSRQLRPRYRRRSRPWPVTSWRTGGLSLRTIEAYEFPLTRQFLPWCAKEGITETSQLTDQLVGQFTTHLLEDGGKHGPLSRASVRSYVRNLRVFLTWAGKADGGSTAVGAKPRMPRPEKRMLDVLTRSEIQRMEDAAPAERDKLLIRVLADTGVRLGELLGLRVEDILEQRKGEYALKVGGKGSRDRLVPLSPALQRRLRRYLTGRRAEARRECSWASGATLPAGTSRCRPEAPRERSRGPPSGRGSVKESIRTFSGTVSRPTG